MKLYQIMLVVYIILNAFVIWRTWAWIDHAFQLDAKKRKMIRIVSAILYILASSTLLVWIPFPRSVARVRMIRVGNFWLGVFIELITCIIIAELITMIAHIIRKKAASKIVTRIIGFVVIVSALTLSIGGNIHSNYLAVNTYDVTVDKKQASVNELKVVLISDLHLGYKVGCEKIERTVQIVNQMNPDVVIIAGDIFDNDYDAIDNPEKLEQLLQQMKPKYGVYAIYGNHDVSAKLVGGFTFGGSKLRDSRMDRFLENSNITVLQDEVTTIADDSIYLVGRLDGEETGIEGTNNSRKSIEELTEGLDSQKPLLVINHEPVKLESYAENGVDVLLSGHTHDGQFFPLTAMNFVAWKNSHGCLKVGDMYSLVTSGIGAYGPDMRMFTDAEVMEINIKFAE